CAACKAALQSSPPLRDQYSCPVAGPSESGGGSAARAGRPEMSRVIAQHADLMSAEAIIASAPTERYRVRAARCGLAAPREPSAKASRKVCYGTSREALSFLQRLC